MTRTKKRVLRLRAKFWRMTCRELGYEPQPMLRLRNFREATKDIRIADEDLKLELNFALLEEILCWYSLCAVYFTEKITPERTRTRAILSPVLAISNMLISYNELSRHGLDFSMRVLARTIGEHCDVLRMLLFNPDLCEEFITEDFDAANHFWYKHVAKGKSRASFFNYLLNDKVFDAESLKEFRLLKEWEADREKKFSLFVHPTWIGGLLNAFAHEDWDNQMSSAPHAFLGRVGTHLRDVLHFVNWKSYHIE